jgi:predicted transcriptional regulator YdeE
VPAAHYAVFDCELSTIGPTWQAAYGQWLPGSAYELDTAAVDFEFYPPHSGEGEMKVEIYIPVKAKEARDPHHAPIPDR